MTVREALEGRRALPAFDPSVAISREELDAIVNEAVLTPSSMNLQPWALLLCHTREDRERLVGVAMNQSKIADASAAFVVLGLLDGHLRHAEDAARSMVQRGYLAPGQEQSWIERAHRGWAQPQVARDEAFRAGALLGMSLMLAATARGWGTAPMGGYSSEALAREFSLPDMVVPVLILCVGWPAPGLEIKPQNFRYSAAELIHEGRY